MEMELDGVRVYEDGTIELLTKRGWRKSKVKGYCFHKGQYHSQIRVNGKSIHLGYYYTKEEARIEYVRAKLQYHYFR
jgi:hypothetical protein